MKGQVWEAIVQPIIQLLHPLRLWQGYQSLQKRYAKVQKSTGKYERAAKSTKAEAIIQLLHRLIGRGARVSQSIIAVAVGGAPTVDSGTEGSECMGFQLFVKYAPPIMGTTGSTLGVYGSTWELGCVKKPKVSQTTFLFWYVLGL